MASSFLFEFCCGCCIHHRQDDEYSSRRSGSSSNHHPHSRHHSRSREHRGYYKYYSQREWADESVRNSSHHQSRRSSPPSAQKIRRDDSRRNGDSRHRNGDKNHFTSSSRRRDDASVMGASLSETYQGYLVQNDEEYMDEQSALRRSLKDASRKKQGAEKSQKSLRQYQSEPETVPSIMKTSKLATHIEEKAKPQSQHRSQREENFDNVTTISKASINPYRVLGLSHGATPREVYDSYKKRRKETHPDAAGGSEKAFADVGNAYRRLRAELKRQEARKERIRCNGAQDPGVNDSEHKSEKQNVKKKSKSSRERKSRRKYVNSDDEEEKNIIKRRENIDDRLKDHRALVQSLFANDAKEQAQKISSNSSVTSAGQVTTLQKAIYSQSRALMALNLVPIEAGATNINEKNKSIQNNCFYLSLAASYLSGAGAFETDPTAVYYLNSTGKNNGRKSKMASDGSVTSTRTLDMEIASLQSAEKSLTMSLALQLKRAIEAAVLLVHPNWASDGVVGEEVQAFSDFLVHALDSDSVLGHWAIAVFDEASGFVDVYRGRHYGKVYPPQKVRRKRYSSGRSLGGKRGPSDSDRDEEQYRYKDCDEFIKRAHTLTLRYIPGHYQPLLPELAKMKNRPETRPTLEELLSTLEKWKVLHVVTDGRA